MSELDSRLLAFGRELRDEGLPVGTGRILDFCRATSLLGPADVYWVGRATLLSRAEDIPAYDRVFQRFWSGTASRPAQVSSALQRVRIEHDEEGEEPQRGRERSPGAARASRLELLREKSFAHLTAEELSELAHLMARLEVSIPRRRVRRREHARRGDPDLRRTIRRSFRTGGEPVHRAWRRRRTHERAVVLIVDVSGSMSAYSRGLVVFAHAALRADAKWEAFCFGTRLTRVTRALRTTDPDVALASAAEEVNDWDGGTRIGDSLKAFLDRFGHGGLARGAIVVICSDGLEVGEPLLLARQMERLARLAHHVVWLNPLQEQSGYEPTARGMAAALPHVGTFASGYSMASLEALAAQLELA